ncbi:AAA family ATPase [Chelativorans sp. AA-79]|uniref:AAA family ATPase n=1 Tax=Chelativorans sp. AA-79 TaxID=3028735 RepID=UPI0023F8A631|nr:AAA family ATPase [Chelativorans sp. AA-79]WEX08935.1 AAA family ATPase [Chelativorans sp. AA-79]
MKSKIVSVNFSKAGIDHAASVLDNVRWKPDGGFTARCPAHDDRRNSLSVSEGDRGKLLAYCHAGCSFEEVAEALNALGVSASAPKTRPKRSKAEEDGLRRVRFVGSKTPDPDFEDICGREPDHVYPYTDTRGRRIGFTVRFDDKKGKRFFQITPWRDDLGRICWRMADFAHPRPLYNLEDLGLADDDPVLIVEGEKAADAAADIFPSHVVLTWHGGANAVRKSDWSPLMGFDVVIWPDADDPGLAAADAIARELRVVGAASVRIVDLPDVLPRGWDLADEVPEGVDVSALVRDAKPVGENLVNFLLSAKALAAMEIPPREMIVAPFLAANSINLLYARRGLGKTWVGITMAKAVALGTDFLAYEVPEARRVLFIDGEMPLSMLQERFQAAGADDIDMIDILPSEIMHRDFHALNINREEDRELITAMLERMAEQDRNPSLIILDNLSSLRMGVEENDNSALDQILLWLLSLRHKGYAILVVHHASKSGDQRGASRLEDLLDTTIKLLPSSEPSGSGAAFDLEFTKTRGVSPEPDHLTLNLVMGGDGLLDWDYGEARKVGPQDTTLRSIYYGPHGDASAPFARQKDLAEALDLQPAAISKHMRYLRRDELVEVGKDAITVTEKGKVHLAALFPGESFE